MSEWIGTFWFLGALYLSSVYVQKLIDPWPNWTLILVVPAHQVVIISFTGVIAWMYG